MGALQIIYTIWKWQFSLVWSPQVFSPTFYFAPKHRRNLKLTMVLVPLNIILCTYVHVPRYVCNHMLKPPVIQRLFSLISKSSQCFTGLCSLNVFSTQCLFPLHPRIHFRETKIAKVSYAFLWMQLSCRIYFKIIFPTWHVFKCFTYLFYIRLLRIMVSKSKFLLFLRRTVHLRERKSKICFKMPLKLNRYCKLHPLVFLSEVWCFQLFFS